MSAKKSGRISIRTWILIAIGSISAGTIDLAYAIAATEHAGIPAIVIPQSIASGLLGIRAFHQGAASAVLGVVLHFSILFVAAVIYFLASRKLKVMADRPMLAGPLYGLAIYLFMHMIVLPLSLAPSFKTTSISIVCDILVHVVLIGPIVAYTIHWARTASPTRN